jgi:predicted acetyltransferase
VGVDLLHKKEKVAKEMILFYLRHYRRRGYPLAALHPFRPDFYRRMGFGYGSKMNQYRIRPGDLPSGKTKAHVRFLGKDDQKAAQACFQRVAGRTHGMFEKTDFEARMMFESPSIRVAGCVREGRVLGYVAFTFKPGKNVLTNPMEVMDWVYETPEVLAELLTFLHTQADQVHEIVFNTQDENFHFLPLDPRNGTGNLITSDSHETNVAGVGIMYRVLHVPRAFQALREHNFGGQTCKLKITLKDSFLRENEGSTIVHFQDGKPTVKPRGEHEAEIRMEVAEFSSLLMGVVPFKSLLAYGLAGISKEKYADTVNRVFMTEAKPICRSDF